MEENLFRVLSFGNFRFEPFFIVEMFLLNIFSLKSAEGYTLFFWNKTLKLCLNILIQNCLEEAEAQWENSIYNLYELMKSWSVSVCCASVHMFLCVAHEGCG